jgi:hypothetical protein
MRDFAPLNHHPLPGASAVGFRSVIAILELRNIVSKGSGECQGTQAEYRELAAAG